MKKLFLSLLTIALLVNACSSNDEETAAPNLPVEKEISNIEKTVLEPGATLSFTSQFEEIEKITLIPFGMGKSVELEIKKTKMMRSTGATVSAVIPDDTPYGVYYILISGDQISYEYLFEEIIINKPGVERPVLIQPENREVMRGLRFHLAGKSLGDSTMARVGYFKNMTNNRRSWDPNLIETNKEGTDYYLQAFASFEAGTKFKIYFEVDGVVSNPVEIDFIENIYSVPIIKSITPLEATLSDTLTLKGNHFENIVKQNMGVSFLNPEDGKYTSYIDEEDLITHNDTIIQFRLDAAAQPIEIDSIALRVYVNGQFSEITKELVKIKE